MSDIVGGKAIALAQSGGVAEVTHARTFKTRGSAGAVYTVTFGTRPLGAVPRYECTCPAHGRCYHGEAAQLVMAKERERTGRGRQLVSDVWGVRAADELARWAIDALCEPPANISTGSTTIGRGLVERGRAILEGMGLDWRKLKGRDSAGRAG
jgi:hypothetical protein